MIPERSIDLVVFDLDGTLIDSTLDIAYATNAMLTERALPPRSVDEVRSFIGDGARKLVERAMAPVGVGVEEALQSFKQHYGAHLLEHTRVYPGIRELLAEVRIPAAVATNKPVAFSETILEGLGLRQYFANVQGGDSLPVKKPHGDVLRKICAELRCSPRRTLMVGDGPQDVGAARNAGTLACRVLWGMRQEGAAVGAAADYTAHDRGELREVLRRLGALSA